MKSRALTKTYGKRRVLEMPAYTFEPGKVYAVIGANGSGKSTLAKILAGMIKADDKTQPFEEKPEGVGYLPQRAYAFRMSVGANIRLAGDNDERAAMLMDALQIAQLENERADRLSGGEKARLAMARIMMKPFDMLILDEPTTSMDMESTILSEELIRTYLDDTDACIILITHSLSQARRMADKVLFLDHGELIEEGDGDQVLNHPKNALTAKFIEMYG